MTHRTRRRERTAALTALASIGICLLVALLALGGGGVTRAQGPAVGAPLRSSAGPQPDDRGSDALDQEVESGLVADVADPGRTLEVSEASLRVTKLGPEQAEVGDEVIYAVTITNDSSDDIPYVSLVTIADTLKGDLTRAENVAGSTCTETLDVGERCQIVYTYTVQSDDPALLVNAVLVEARPAESTEVIRTSASHSMAITRFVYLPTMMNSYPPPWTQGTGMPAGVQVRTLAVCPSDPDVVYAGFGVNGRGVYKSTDAGATWSQTGLRAAQVFGLAVAPETCDTVCAGAWDARVMKSVNGGDSWFSSSSGLAGTLVYGVVIDPQDSDRLYIGTAQSGVYESLDAGASWSQWGLNGRAVPDLGFTPDGEHLYAATWGEGVYRRLRTGTLLGPWEAVNAGIAGAHRNVYAVTADPQDGGTVFAATSAGGVYRTTDGAGSWSQVLASAAGAFDVAVDPGEGGIVYAGLPEGVYRSAAGGDAGSWRWWNAGLGDLGARALAIGPDSAEYVHVGTGDGAWRLAR